MRNIIKEIRGNLSQKELAERIGMTQEAISRLESNKEKSKRSIKIETLEKIAAAVGKCVVWTIEDIKEEKVKLENE